MIPFTCQVTALFAVPVTVARKNCVLPAWTVACVGEIKIRTETRGGGADPEPPQPGNDTKDETTTAIRISRRRGIVPLVFSRKWFVVAWQIRCNRRKGIQVTRWTRNIDPIGSARCRLPSYLTSESNRIITLEPVAMMIWTTAPGFV